jgi:hypothetical protein
MNNSKKNIFKEQEKLNLLHQLVDMAKADRVFKRVEYRYLLEIALVLGVSTEKLKQIIDSNKESNMPVTHQARFRQIYRLAVMMMVDGIITIEEIALLKNYGVEMGLQPKSIEIMIKRMNENKGGMLLDIDLEEIFSLQNN